MKTKIIIERPPLGLIPKKFYEEQIKVQRFQDVCDAIKRYWDANLKIPVEWIEEHNELVDFMNQNEIRINA